jgi:hypothetical protein
MALAERKDTKDFIGIYNTEDWRLLNVRIFLMTEVFLSRNLRFSRHALDF